MGAVKSFTHAYTWGEYLFHHIQRRDHVRVEEVLGKRADLIEGPISVVYRTTPLYRAAYNGDLPLVRLLIEKYGAKVDGVTVAGETPLIAATKRNHTSVMRYLVSAKANPTFATPKGLTVIDHAILFGLYENALFLLENSAQGAVKEQAQYQDLRVQFKLRYVNYAALLKALKGRLPVESAPDFLKKEKKTWRDPVIDPRESWREWLGRHLQFKDPPIVERNELPQELQPQNRRFGKIRHFFHSKALSPLTASVSFLPHSHSQMGEAARTEVEEKHSDMQLHSIS